MINILTEAAGMFSKVHLIYVLIFLVLIIIGIVLINKYGRKNIRKITLIIAIITTLAELYKIGYTHYLDHIILNIDKSVPSRWIPLSFCSLFIYSLWFSLSKNTLIHKIGQTFLVSGALFAGVSFLTYPSTAIGDWPWWHFYSLHGMTLYLEEKLSSKIDSPYPSNSLLFTRMSHGF